MVFTTVRMQPRRVVSQQPKPQPVDVFRGTGPLRGNLNQPLPQPFRKCLWLRNDTKHRPGGGPFKAKTAGLACQLPTRVPAYPVCHAKTQAPSRRTLSKHARLRTDPVSNRSQPGGRLIF